MYQLSEAVSDLAQSESLDDHDDQEVDVDVESEGSKEEEEDSNEEGDFPWPDTTISVAHISGDK